MQRKKGGMTEAFSAGKWLMMASESELTNETIWCVDRHACKSFREQ